MCSQESQPANKKQEISLLLEKPYINISDKISQIIIDIIEHKENKDINPLETKRNKAYIVDINNEKLLLKFYFHGGLIRYFIPSNYFLRNRGLKEYTFYSNNLISQKFAPQYIGAFWKKELFFYITGTISKYIPHSEDLESIITRGIHEENSEKIVFLQKVGRTIRLMHDEGIYHGDLHPKNILVKYPEDISDHEPQIYIIDYDKSKIKKPMGIFWRTLNLLRLRRYFIKNKLPLHYFNHIITGYGISKLSVMAKVISFPHMLWAKLRSYEY